LYFTIFYVSIHTPLLVVDCAKPIVLSHITKAGLLIIWLAVVSNTAINKIYPFCADFCKPPNPLTPWVKIPNSFFILYCVKSAISQSLAWPLAAPTGS
jgi:hypothetical protein